MIREYIHPSGNKFTISSKIDSSYLLPKKCDINHNHYLIRVIASVKLIRYHASTMHYTLTTKGCKLSTTDKKLLTHYLEKLVVFLSGFSTDVPLINIVITQHKKKNLSHGDKKFITEYELKTVQLHPSIDNPIYLDGTLTLSLPKKTLVVHHMGKSIDESLHTGFIRLFKELDKYKGTHFVSDSEYENHSSIRKQGEELWK